jgi:hypothetical protein
VEGFGELSYVELEGPKKGVAQRIAGPLTLLSVRGRTRRAGGFQISEFVCTVSRNLDSGVQVLGGRLLGGLATLLELRLHPLSTLEDAASADDDERKEERPTAPKAAPVVERREPLVRAVAQSPAAPATALLTQDSMSSEGFPSPSKEGASTPGWAEVFAESQRLRRAAAAEGIDDELDDGEDHHPERGDFVEHRQFGRCRVVRIDDDHMALKKPDGRIVQLGLQVLQFRPKGEAEGKKIYEAFVKPR